MNWIWRIAIGALVTYALLCVILFAYQESLIFRPRQLPADFVFAGGEELYVPTSDGVELNVVAFRKPEARGAILFLHGNRGSNRRSFRQTEALMDTDYDLYLFDYRGYGKSGGSITSEEQLYEDAQTMYDTLLNHYSEEHIIVAGYSLGTGMASYLAAENNPEYCVLAAPYASITAMKNLWLWMVPDFILKYPLNTVDNVARSRCPVTVIHGQRDDFIPFDMAEEIKAVAPDRVQLIPLPDVGHRGAILDPTFARTILRLIE
ncbi:alpha/beta hydrolase [Lewinella sp. IMCC34191]|uniref:alpha/beta hydrolase n=1 Tax=Lewinella sp. IMCC34191 TaxID=2259172 RepID=UPI000E270FD7|nr:alpha/beta fold hydrolase [Lewinella sp. IMCC34191]